MFDIYSGLEKQKSRFPENRYTKNVAVISKFDTRAASTRTITTVGIVPGGGLEPFLLFSVVTSTSEYAPLNIR